MLGGALRRGPVLSLTRGCVFHACLLLLQVWLQQVKYNWRDSPPVAEFARKLSLECQDLLDKVWQQGSGVQGQKSIRHRTGRQGEEREGVGRVLLLAQEAGLVCTCLCLPSSCCPYVSHSRRAW